MSRYLRLIILVLGVTGTGMPWPELAPAAVSIKPQSAPAPIQQQKKPAEEEKRGVVVTPQVAAGSVPMSGEYWALIIGIDKYQHAPHLESAVKDAKGVRDVLVERYGFKKDRVTELFNDQATGPKIQNALYQLGRQAGKDDSVFIYYAGHGQYDEDGRLGWWVPVEAQPKDPGTFIMDTSVLSFVKGMKAKHVYLVADSCFSGTLFGTRALPPLNDQFFARLYSKPSRWGLTSGGTEPVADQGKNGHSIFAYHFIALLKENADPYLVPSHIYDQLAPLIANNADQTPRSEPLKGAGDEGGQFVFRLASASSGPVPPSSSGGGAEDMTALKKRLEELEGKLAKPVEPPRPIEEARARPYDAPQQTGREITGKDGAPMLLVPEGEFLRGENRARLGVAIRDVTADDAKRLSAKEGQGALITGLDPAGPGGKAGLQQHDIIVSMGERPIGKAGDLTALVSEAAPGWRTTVEIVRGGERKTIPIELGVLRSEGRVYVDAFYMDKYEVTTDLYAKFLQATGRKEPDGWTQARQVSAGDRPVIGVDWHDADAYCRYYEKRLPTEAEWEKAARGTDGRKYPWGNAAPTPAHANYGQDGQGQYNVYGDKVKPVGSYEQGKSPYGIYDLAGNVDEWVADWFSHDLSGPGRNPTGPTSGTEKVLRGGSWNDNAYALRSAGRYGYDPSFRYYYYGFRCAKTP